MRTSPLFCRGFHFFSHYFKIESREYLYVSVCIYVRLSVCICLLYSPNGWADFAEGYLKVLVPFFLGLKKKWWHHGAYFVEILCRTLSRLSFKIDFNQMCMQCRIHCGIIRMIKETFLFLLRWFVRRFEA